MLISSNNGNGSSSINRRRGTSNRRKRDMILNSKSILVLFALCATIFSMGLIVGTRLFGGGSISDSDAANASSSDSGNSPEHISPLMAATKNKKVAPSDIQNLILESARAEKIERKEHELEVEALKHGDTKLAAHLRGALAPGDTNYNPHHHVDDVVENEFGDTSEGGGDNGGMYAGDTGNHHKDEEGEGSNMHNHFVEAFKNELKIVKDDVKREKDHIVESMHNQFAAALENERKVSEVVKEKVHDIKEGVTKKLRGSHNADDGRDGISSTSNGAGEGSEGSGHASSSNKSYPGGSLSTTGGQVGGGSKGYYPYMTQPISPTYDFSQYEPLGGHRFVEYTKGDTPYEITPNLRQQSDELARSRRVHVLNAMKHVWKNYREYAFGRDEFHPISKKATSNWGGMGTTLVDSLDTLWLMGMKDEFWEGRDWVRDNLSHDHVGQVSGFETTIRSLGGLLSAYDFSKDGIFLEKAKDLGSRLIKAYDTPSGLPRGSVNLQNGHSQNFGWNQNAYILAEVGTQQIEYRYLSRASGDGSFEKKSDHVFEILNDLQPKDGLLSQNIKDGGGHPKFVSNKVSFGAMGDSVYEYMLKVWVQGGKKEPMYRNMWDKAMMGLHDQLVQKSSPNGLTYIADRNNGRIDKKMDHLVCFMGGALALSAYTDPKGLDSDRAQRDLRTAKALTYTCYQMYARMKTGIAPEFVQFSGEDDMRVGSGAPFYILRPETVEAFYYMSVLTGDPVYREWGWEVFQSIEKYCKTKYGYGSLKNVNNIDSVEDRMESFFMAETLKYLYLLFDPDSEIDILNKHVFNTEAHPTRIFED